MSPALFKSLSADTARTFLTSLSTGIQDRLVDQADRSGDSTDTKPLIKVTTVKMLAELLSGASFIDQVSACRILIPILHVAKHIDIVCAVVASLIDAFASTSDPTVEVVVLDALQQYAAPIMSSMDERKPLSEDEWNTFETTPEKLPEVYMEVYAAEIPPNWSVVLNALHRVEDQKRAQLFERVLLPALRGSMQNHGRWLKLFCRHTGVPTFELSHIPSKLNIVNELFAFAAHLPAVVADTWLAVFKSTFDPPAEIQTVTQIVEQDVELRNSNAGQHWLSLFGEMANIALLRGASPASLLVSEWKAVAGRPRIPQVQSIVLQQAGLIMHKACTSLQQWTMFIASLAPSAWQTSTFLLWCHNTRPVLVEIVERVNRLRTAEWQLDMNRIPAVLPDTFSLRLWLLCGPGDEALPQLLRGLKDLLTEIASARKPYTGNYDLIITFLRNLGMPSDDLGSLDGLDSKHSFDLADHLRVDMAKQIIQAQQAPHDISLRTSVIDLILKWSKSFDEDMRMVGLQLRNTALASVAARETGHSGLWYVDRVDD